jgi:hypothetical protein
MSLRRLSSRHHTRSCAGDHAYNIVVTVSTAKLLGQAARSNRAAGVQLEQVIRKLLASRIELIGKEYQGVGSTCWEYLRHHAVTDQEDMRKFTFSL